MITDLTHWTRISSLRRESQPEQVECYHCGETAYPQEETTYVSLISKEVGDKYIHNACYLEIWAGLRGMTMEDIRSRGLDKPWAAGVTINGI